MIRSGRTVLLTGVARRQRAAGFTLVELLVGLTVSTLILGAAAGVMMTVLQSWEWGSSSTRALQAAQTTADLIERHLRCATPPDRFPYGTFTGEDLTESELVGHRLTFHSAASGRFPRSAPPTDLCEVEFALDPATVDGMTVRIQSNPDEYSDEGGYRIALSPAIYGFTVSYFDGTEWYDEWMTNQLPVAVEISLAVMVDEPDEHSEEPPQLLMTRRLIRLPMGRPTGTLMDPIGTEEVLPQ